MSNRAFGVEIECYAHSKFYRGHVDGYNNYDPVGATQALLDNNGYQEWAEITTYDDSLHNYDGGVEIKSPPLQGSKGFRELKVVLSLLNINKFFVDETCGMHVHHDSPEFTDNPDLVVRLVRSWMENQHLIDNMVASHRIGNTYCSAWSEEEYGWLLAGSDDADMIDRCSLNIHSLAEYQTIEIRQHEGTLNFDEAYAWITFGQKFIDTVAKRSTPIPMLNDEELLLKRVKVQKRTNDFLSTKVRRNKRRK